MSTRAFPQEQSLQREELYTYEEAAKALDKSIAGIKRDISRGILHPIKIPYEIRKYLRKSEVDQLKVKKFVHPVRPLGKVVSDLLESPDVQEFMQAIFPVIYTFGISHTDNAETKNELRQTLLEYIQSTDSSEFEQETLRQLVRTFTEKLMHKDLSLAEKKIYRELLDAAMKAVQDLNETATA